MKTYSMLVDFFDGEERVWSGQITRNQQWKAWPTDQTITSSNFNFPRLCQVMATHKIAIISLIL